MGGRRVPGAAGELEWRTLLAGRGAEIPESRVPLSCSRLPAAGPSPRGLSGRPARGRESNAQRSLAGYSPWSLKVSDMTERLKNNNSSLGCISSLDLVPGSRHATTYLGFPPGNQHSHSLQHVEDRTHCFPLNIFPLNTSQQGEPQ